MSWSDHKCRFCDQKQMVRNESYRRFWSVCKDHIKVKCPLCGSDAYWVEELVTGAFGGAPAHSEKFVCFGHSPFCSWNSGAPPITYLKKA